MSVKISDLTAKGSALASTDLIEIAQVSGGSYISKRVTGQNIIDAAGGGTVTSVDLTMPSAFTVSGDPITTAGTLAVAAAGVATQYIRGDGQLANFPTSSGGGASVSYYLNGSVSQGTFGGVAMKEINKTPIIGAGTDFTIATNGYIQSFITDANDPNQLEIPAGNWNFETYFSASSSGGTPSFYVELYKWDGATLTLIASNSVNPEGITNGTVTDLYVSALAVPQTTLALTDRLAVRIYVNNSGRTITLHTENSHLCQVITTFSTGLTALNGLTAQVQNLSVGTSGTDFAINSVSSTHTFNLPTASATNRGALSSADWSTFNGKVATTRNITINGTTQDLSADRTFSAVMLTGLPGVANIGTSGAIRYFAFSGVATATSEITRRIIMCNNITVKNFYIYTSTAQPATGNHVLTILKNGVATSIVVTIASGSAAGLFSDTTNSESFAQGDAISIQAVNNATSNSGTIVSFQIGSL